jgi:transcriptional regulator with XRE-family HTH domain
LSQEVEADVARRTWTVHSGEDLGRALADIRQRRGLTQAELAERSGLSRSYLAKIEAGRSVSLLEHVLRVLRRLGATVTVPFEDADGQA